MMHRGGELNDQELRRASPEIASEPRVDAACACSARSKSLNTALRRMSRNNTALVEGSP